MDKLSLKIEVPIYHNGRLDKTSANVIKHTLDKVGVKYVDEALIDKGTRGKFLSMTFNLDSDEELLTNVLRLELVNAH